MQVFLKNMSLAFPLSATENKLCSVIHKSVSGTVTTALKNMGVSQASFSRFFPSISLRITIARTFVK